VGPRLYFATHTHIHTHTHTHTHTHARRKVTPTNVYIYLYIYVYMPFRWEAALSVRVSFKQHHRRAIEALVEAGSPAARAEPQTDYLSALASSGLD